jgi:hypothetical protein
VCGSQSAANAHTLLLLLRLGAKRPPPLLLRPTHAAAAASCFLALVDNVLSSLSCPPAALQVATPPTASASEPVLQPNLTAPLASAPAAGAESAPEPIITTTTTSAAPTTAAATPSPPFDAAASAEGEERLPSVQLSRSQEEAVPLPLPLSPSGAESGGTAVPTTAVPAAEGGTLEVRAGQGCCTRLLAWVAVLLFPACVPAGFASIAAHSLLHLGGSPCCHCLFCFHSLLPNALQPAAVAPSHPTHSLLCFRPLFCLSCPAGRQGPCC